MVNVPLSRLVTHCPLPELYRRDDFCMLTNEQLAIVGERQKERDGNKVKPLEKKGENSAALFFKGIATLALPFGLYFLMIFALYGDPKVGHGKSHNLTGAVHHDAHERAIDGGLSHASAGSDP